MKTTIKIHDTLWFGTHCRVRAATMDFVELTPKYAVWRHRTTLGWIHGEAAMNPLEGRVLEVEHDCGNENGAMDDSRYMTKGYWIPNWAIEWVKEE